MLIHFWYLSTPKCGLLMKKLIFFSVLFSSKILPVNAQAIDSIFINLYYDSLKMNVHNYINVDAKLSNGSYIPLSAKEVNFTSDYGKWEGNSLLVDSSCKREFIQVQAQLKSNPQLKKSVIIYLKKVNEPVALPTTEELLEKWKREAKDKKRNKSQR